MLYNITCYGKLRTSFQSYNNPKDAQKYLLRKKKEGFHLIHNVEGKISECALSVGNGRVNIWISCY